MEYFVSSENTTYQQWQYELMIESFKAHGEANNLVISVAETDDPGYLFCVNINDHKNKFSHNNVGEKRGFKKLNQLYSLIYCLQNGKLKNEFTILEPHVLLSQGDFKPFTDDQPRACIFAPDATFTFQQAEKMAGDFWEVMPNNKEFYMKNWVPLGNVMCFKEFSLEFFNRVLLVAETLILRQLINKKPVWEETVKLSWALNLSDVFDQAYIFGTYGLSSTMIDSKVTPFIDYEHGMPPVFNKSMFTYPMPNRICFGDPIETISNLIQTPTAHYMSELASNILKKRS